MFTGAIGKVDNAAQSSVVKDSWPPLVDGTLLRWHRQVEREGKVCEARVVLEQMSVSIHTSLAVILKGKGAP